VGPFDFLFLFALFVMLIVSQIFWVGRVVGLGRFIPGKPRRALLTAIASVVCLFFFAYNIGPYIAPWEIPRGDSTHLTLRQLSDFHISPFLTADKIRRCVTIANGLKADLVALTGDYVADDPAAQGEVVQALAGLRAPFGVFGCLGNHEIYTETEDSITRLFAAAGIRILRQERTPIQSHGEVLT
jgi:predicted MPP superfamily phosphohydrolase